MRFAYSPQDRRRITKQLTRDALQAALAAGLVEPRTRAGLQQRSGRVQGVIGSRALVTLDDVLSALSRLLPHTRWSTFFVTPAKPVDTPGIIGSWFSSTRLGFILPRHGTSRRGALPTTSPSCGKR